MGVTIRRYYAISDLGYHIGRRIPVCYIGRRISYRSSECLYRTSDKISDVGYHIGRRISYRSSELISDVGYAISDFGYHIGRRICYIGRRISYLWWPIGVIRVGQYFRQFGEKSDSVRRSRT